MVDGVPHGFGRKIFGNAQYYIGKFEKGEVNGFGTLYDGFDHVLEQGFWRKGQITSEHDNVYVPT